MIKCSTYRPRGNHERCAQVYGLAQELLRVTDDLRDKMQVPFLSNQRWIDDGLTLLRVLASQDHNSIIEITSNVPPEEPKKHIVRQRLLHCRIELTLAEDLPENIDTDDGTIGWPYQKDPSFIAVEPIPIKEGEENKIIFHTTFEVDLRRGIIVDGLNGERDDEEACEDRLGRKDACRLLSLEDAEKLITMRTKYNLVHKLINENEDPVKVYDPHNKIRPEEAISGGTEFNALDTSSIMTHLNQPAFIYEKHEYRTNFLGNQRVISGAARAIREPVETFTTPFLSNEKDVTEPLHLISSCANYIDTIEEELGGDNPDTPQYEGNIHPYGNINSEKLRHCYGQANYFLAPFKLISTDFTPRLGDKVFIGDISTAATRKKTTWFTYYDDDDNEITLFPDGKLISSVFPYYVEAKCAEDIAAEFETLTVDWNFYSRNPTKFVISGPERDENGDPIEGEDFYTPWSPNWILHPYRNDSWATYLRDFFTMDDGAAEVNLNTFFAHTEMMVNPEYVYADIPNRMILCVRSFFANTDNATNFAGTRRSYDLEFPSLHYDGAATNGNRPYEFTVPGTYDEVPTETSQPLSIENSPNFVTIKGDVVVVNLLSSIYAVSDYAAVTEDVIKLSNRHVGIDLVEDSAVPVDTVTAKRPWPAILDGDWEYTNIYGAGITVDYMSSKKNKFIFYSQTGDVYPTRSIYAEYPYKYVERASRGESIYSDSTEDVSQRYAEDQEKMADVTWHEEDTPESHLIHCIYRELEKEGYDIHHPVCHIKIETNLYDRYFDLKTLKVVE